MPSVISRRSTTGHSRLLLLFQLRRVDRCSLHHIQLQTCTTSHLPQSPLTLQASRNPAHRAATAVESQATGPVMLHGASAAPSVASGATWPNLVCPHQVLVVVVQLQYT